MTLSFRNRQRTRALNTPLLRRITRRLLQHEFKVADCELCFHFVAPAEMAEVNWQFLQHEGSTDVITFDYSDVASGVPPDVEGWRPAARNELAKHPPAQEISHPVHRAGRHGSTAGETPASTTSLRGEIFISIADAVQQAREFGTTWQSELVRYIIHGLLHLRGYDDLQPAQRRVMKREENRFLKLVTAKFPIASRPRRSQLSTLNSQPR